MPLNQKIILPQPSFDSPITDLIIDLDFLRRKKLIGSTRPWIFFQLKTIFHLMESLGSARIEGNNTTLAEYIEKKINQTDEKKPNILEIENMEKGMAFVDAKIHENFQIDQTFIMDLHRLVVENLPPPPYGEGDIYLDRYRPHSVQIANSPHRPLHPDFIPSAMEDFFCFINQQDQPKYDLLKIAISHHRFMWIHPFANGNGRTGRLLTYALLVRQGFNVAEGRILNPTAIFCCDRKKYYEKLAIADSYSKENLLEWCEYVLSGLKAEIEKIDALLDHDFLKNSIVIPALSDSLARKYITPIEERILSKSIQNKNQLIEASDISKIIEFHTQTKPHPTTVSRMIRQLREKKMLAPLQDKSRKYFLRFDSSYLLRSIIKILGEKGFLSIKD